MRVWVIQDGEPIPGIDGNTRKWRSAMLCEALAVKGHEVLWWASLFDHFTKQQRSVRLPMPEVIPGVHVKFLAGPGYQNNKSPMRWLHHYSTARHFRKEARSLPRPDLIFASLPTPELAEQAVVFGREIGIPVFVDVRDLWPDHYLTLVPSFLQSIAQLLLTTEYRRVQRLLGQATGITSISESFLRWGLKHAARERRNADAVFTMGYPAIEFTDEQVSAQQQKLISQYGLKSDDLTIVFSGSLNSIFDFDSVLQAAKTLEHTGIKVKFVFLGDGPRLAKLVSDAEDLHNVVFTGRLEHLPLISILSFADVSLAPYAEGGSISGSLSNKIFEYMALGLPLLSSLSGELTELISKHRIGLNYKANCAQDLVEKIIWFASHSTERLEMGQRALRLFHERYSAEIVYTKFVKHLESIVESSKDDSLR